MKVIQNKLDECILHPAKMMANSATKSLLLTPKSAQQIQWHKTHRISCCLASKTTQQLWQQCLPILHFSWLLSHFLQELIKSLQPPFTTILSSWLMNWLQREHLLPRIFLMTLSLMPNTNRIMREHHALKQPHFKLLSWLIFIPKYPFTSAKIAEYFVRENESSNSGDSTNTPTLLALALLVTLALQE